MSRVWASDLEAKPLIATRVRCKADDLFKTLWVSTDLQAQLHKLRNDTNLMETVWMGSRDELPKEQYTWDPAAVNGAAAGKNTVASNRWRKVRFESPPAAMATKPFQNEEVQHCVDYKPGQRYVVEAQCNTSAPYGDKFDLLFRISILAETKTTCFLHIVFDIKWSPSMNRMLKGMITKAVEGGVRGTYKTYRQVLETFYSVEDVPESQLKEVEQEGEEAAVGGAAHVEPVASILPPPPQPHRRELEQGFFNFAVGQLVWGDQVSAVSDMVGAGLQSAASEGPMARIMALVVTLSMLHTAVSMLHSVQTFCTGRGGLLWLLCLPITHIIDVPDSVMEVLSSLALVAGINYAIIRAAQASVAHARKPAANHAHAQRTPSSAEPAHSAASQHARASSDSALSGSAASASADVQVPLKPGTTKVMGKGQPIPMAPAAAAAAVSARAASPSKKGKPAVPATSAASTSSAPADVGAGPSGTSKMPPRAASPAQSGRKGPTPPASKGGGSMELTALTSSGGSKVTSPQRITSPPASTTDVSGVAGGVQMSTSPPSADGSQGPEPMKAWLRSVSSGIDSMTEGLKGAFGVGGVPTGTGPPGTAGTAVLPSGVHPSASARTLKQSGLTSTPEGGDGEEEVSEPPVLQHVHAASEGGAGPKVPGQSTKSQVVYGARFPLSAMVNEMEARNKAAAAAGSGGSLGTTSLGFGRTASGSESMMTAQDIDPDVVEEELFENERFQPFRGWGHTWPGHFLPSDRVGHWGDRNGKPGGTASMIFEQVEPPLPPGFRWEEEEWQLDLKGFDKEAVDENGWTYALDFNYLRYPAPPGGGKCTLKHFVRRRRWFRTRVREAMDAMPIPQPQEMDKDGQVHHVPGTTPSPAKALAQPLAASNTSPISGAPHGSASEGAAGVGGLTSPGGSLTGGAALLSPTSTASAPAVTTILAHTASPPTSATGGSAATGGSSGAAAAGGVPAANGNGVHEAPAAPVPNGPLTTTRITRGDPLGGASSGGHSRHDSGIPDASLPATAAAAGSAAAALVPPTAFAPATSSASATAIPSVSSSGALAADGPTRSTASPARAAPPRPSSTAEVPAAAAAGESSSSTSTRGPHAPPDHTPSLVSWTSWQAAGDGAITGGVARDRARGSLGTGADPGVGPGAQQAQSNSKEGAGMLPAGSSPLSVGSGGVVFAAEELAGDEQ